MQYEGINSSETIGVFAIFAGAAFKVLPSMNRIFTNMQWLKYGNEETNKFSNNKVCK